MIHSFVPNMALFFSMMLLLIMDHVAAADNPPPFHHSSLTRRLAPKGKGGTGKGGGKGKGKSSSTKAPTLSPSSNPSTSPSSYPSTSPFSGELVESILCKKVSDEVTMRLRFNAEGCDDEGSVFLVLEITYTDDGPTYTVVGEYSSFESGVSWRELELSRNGCYAVVAVFAEMDIDEELELCTSAFVTYDDSVYTYVSPEYDFYGIWGEGCALQAIVDLYDKGFE